MEARKIMMQKSYSINNANFKLKQDLTLDESEEVQELFQNLFIRENQTKGQQVLVTGSLSNSEVKKILSIVLEPVSQPGGPGENKCREFDFGMTKESVVVEIIKDFFLNRIMKYQNFTASCTESIKQQQ